MGEATDGKTKQKVAIRMVSKLAPRIYRETEMIMYISSIDPDHTFDCVRMLDYNVFRGFHYVVTDLFDTSVKKYIKEHHPNGIALEVSNTSVSQNIKYYSTISRMLLQWDARS